METIKKALQKDYIFYLVLLVVLFLAYGVLAPSLGFYWDGWPFAWIAETQGWEGFTRYFATNRPVWGLLYKLTTPILGANPLAWQVFAILMRWLVGITLFHLLKQLWPERSANRIWVTLLFSVYPGFGQHSISIVYGHYYIVLGLALLSLYLMLVILKQQKISLVIYFLSLLSGGYALFAAEYFFGLELMRPILTWLVISRQTNSHKETAIKVLKYWWPYLIVLGVYVYWRVFALTFLTYDPVLLTEVAQSPIQRIVSLALTMLKDSWKSGVEVWGYALSVLTKLNFGSLTSLLNLGVVVFGVVGLILYMSLRKRNEESKPRQDWIIAGIGVLALFTGGIPIWIPALPMSFEFPNDRFTLPMMLGSSLLIVGLIQTLIKSEKIKIGLLATLVGIGIGMQFYAATDYRQDWKYQQSFFQQLVWRAPYIEPGTTFISTEIKLFHSSDNSLTAPINWIYSPENHTQEMDYLLAYVPQRNKPGSTLPNLSFGQPIFNNYLATTFTGDTDHLLLLYHAPPACLLILDPLYDLNHPQINKYLEDILFLSNPALISTQSTAQLPAEIFDIQPNEENWCYYFQKATLARQYGDWATVAALGDIAFQLTDSPNIAAERVPFIEGYAMVGEWEKAANQTDLVLEINPNTSAMLCDLWQRVAAKTENPTTTSMLKKTCD